MDCSTKIISESVILLHDFKINALSTFVIEKNQF